ncbi:hypothetical protein [Halocatena salina]|uniref:Uncharacterized protein n=1 Tax=Halocatena salina TaxID=2934340 RepID=A0A8T9ZZ00_9EURY|nr:hypothetical protein [Halocatena salina]UPM41955.1 hypothetical protein MW046_08220 [Halocatena salina]
MAIPSLRSVRRTSDRVSNAIDSLKEPSSTFEVEIAAGLSTEKRKNALDET